MTDAIPEGNSTATLHNQSWDQIIRLLRHESEQTGNPTPETIANTIEAQGVGVYEGDEPEPLPEDDAPRFAVGFCGLPGSGKTTVAETAANMTEHGVALSMGDAIRKEYVRAHYGDIDEDEYAGVAIDGDHLGEFAAETRADRAETIPEWLCHLAAEQDEDFFFVDGVRSVTDYHVLDEFFDGFVLVDVQADFYTRLDRLQDRGREGESKFSPGDLLERDEREFDDLGYRALIEFEWDGEEYLPDNTYTKYDMGLVDVEMVNDGDLSELRDYVGHLVAEVSFLPTPEMPLKQ